MDETIFFNPGDAIATEYDFAAARRSAEIFKVAHASDKGLVVAKDDHGQFAVFYEGGTSTGDGAVPATKYTILAHL
ncbi:hypothetical protein [Lacticaseibacillus suibinensis]|uniref:hypothetical protein n=1 Tax=Lacticaseibacillus suibinensis TaxID=2486011 RepID=UPI000F7740B2|nr:hypothetical protein [Lacticaseibacillus suibinensis]